jgi:hypothetical protein
MVSHAHEQRHLARALSALLLALWAGACSRQLELYDEPDASVAPVGNGPQAPEDIPEVVDSGVTGGERAACAERPTGKCQGANDFPCDFSGWVERTMRQCEAAADCRANGWVRVSLASDGCVSAIGMVVPEPTFVACLAQEFGSFGCTQCGAMEAVHYLGEGNNGCITACESDDDCDAEQLCQNGYCQRRLG